MSDLKLTAASLAETIAKSFTSGHIKVAKEYLEFRSKTDSWLAYIFSNQGIVVITPEESSKQLALPVMWKQEKKKRSANSIVRVFVHSYAHSDPKQPISVWPGCGGLKVTVKTDLADTHVLAINCTGGPFELTKLDIKQTENTRGDR